MDLPVSMDIEQNPGPTQEKDLKSGFGAINFTNLNSYFSAFSRIFYSRTELINLGKMKAYLQKDIFLKLKFLGVKKDCPFFSYCSTKYRICRAGKAFKLRETQKAQLFIHYFVFTSACCKPEKTWFITHPPTSLRSHWLKCTTWHKIVGRVSGDIPLPIWYPSFDFVRHL